MPAISDTSRAAMRLFHVELRKVADGGIVTEHNTQDLKRTTLSAIERATSEREVLVVLSQLFAVVEELLTTNCGNVPEKAILKREVQAFARQRIASLKALEALDKFAIDG